MMRQLKVTGGEWIVAPVERNDYPNFLFVRQSESNYVIAVLPPKDGQPNWHDAALLASAHLMLDTLIQIYELVNNSKDAYSIADINALICDPMEKIIIEADV